jgi:hypothetical protein
MGLLIKTYKLSPVHLKHPQKTSPPYIRPIWITTVELGVAWLHMDGREWDKKGNVVLKINV